MLLPIAVHKFAHRFIRKYSLFLLYGFVVLAGWLSYTFIEKSRLYSLCALVLATILFVYSRFIEPNWLVVKHITLSNTKITHPIRIAFLSDLHVGCGKGFLWTERIVEKVQELKPDLILLGGDLINNQFPAGDETRYLTPLLQLKQFPIYYVLGNHDYGYGNFRRVFFEDNSAQVINRMSQMGIPLLRDDLVETIINNQRLAIFGSNDYWSHPINFSRALNVDDQTPLVFLTHNPDAVTEWPSTGRQPDLTVAGHAHGGGQITIFRFPFGGSILKLGRKYDYGLKTYRGLTMYVSSGLGESTLPLRFGARPEIAIIEIKPE